MKILVIFSCAAFIRIYPNYYNHWKFTVPSFVILRIRSKLPFSCRSWPNKSHRLPQTGLSGFRLLLKLCSVTRLPFTSANSTHLKPTTFTFETRERNAAAGNF